jgi:hypothetical protein
MTRTELEQKQQELIAHLQEGYGTEMVQAWEYKLKHKLESEIASLIEQKPDCYDKRFIEWMLKNGAYSDVPYKTYTQKWNIQIENYDWVYFTTEEAFEYWKNDIKDKEQ